jgi:nucleoside-diphosphate-sugar epimerase
MKKICVTGANGFIGSAISKALAEKNKTVIGFVRNLNSLKKSNNINYIPMGDISIEPKWKDVLKDVDCIIHSAGAAHIINKTKTKKLNIYNSINVDGTKKLAEQAAEAGVKKLIFLSSAKVNGESSVNNDKSVFNDKKKIFKYNDIPDPQHPYAVSKFEAEKVLWEISSKTNLEVVVIRLPLVYGQNVKGNLARLIKIIKTGIPLPLGKIKNQRSMIAIDNLVDLIICCIDHPKANGETFLVSDGEDLSTTELIELIASSMGRKANLFSIPLFLLKILGSFFGRRDEIKRLTSSFRIDSNYTREKLSWIPPIGVKEGIKRMLQEKC